MTNGIQDKVVLITGGSTGIGAETARLLAARGAKVAIAARRRDKLDTVVEEITGEGGIARAYTLDVTDKAAVQAVVASIVADFGRLDVLINNAGLMPIRPMAEVNTEEWDAMIDVNLKGTLYGIAAVLPGFLARGAGHIINLSSVAGLKVFAPGGTVYSGTKFAVSAISEGLQDKQRILVFGATSQQGGSVAAALLAAGWSVQGAEQVLLVSSNAVARGGNPIAQHANAIAVAKDLGVQRIFYTSQVSASPTSLFPPGRDHAATEVLLAQSGIAWTALCHGFYAQSLLAMQGK